MLNKPLKPGISLCCITSDEEEACVQDFLKAWKPYVSEIRIVPTVGKCEDFSAARNQSLNLAGCTMSMYADMDERPVGGWDKICKLGLGHYLVNIKSKMPDGSVEEILQERIFPTGKAHFKGAVHERIQHDEVQLVKLEGLHIAHSGYSDEKVLEQKRKRNLNIIEKNLDDPVMVYYLGQDHDRCGDPLTALGCYIWAGCKNTNSVLQSRLNLCIGKCLALIGNPGLALKHTLKSDDVDVEYYVAIIYDAMGDEMNAHKYYMEYLNKKIRYSPFGSMRHILAPMAKNRIDVLRDY